jgi:hypothetical protein
VSLVASTEPSRGKSQRSLLVSVRTTFRTDNSARGSCGAEGVYNCADWNTCAGAEGWKDWWRYGGGRALNCPWFLHFKTWFTARPAAFAFSSASHSNFFLIAEGH